MLPTPDTPDLPDSIYPPSEDSYLVLDTISAPEQTSFLKSRFMTSPCPLVVDLGTGSGVILSLIMAHVQTIFGRSDVLGMGIDINRDACGYSRDTVQLNCRQRTSATTGTYLTTLNTSLFSGVRRRQIDLLIFNPPYVPTPDVPGSEPIDDQRPRSRDAAFNRDSHLLSLSYCGGKDGMEVTNKVLEELPYVLSDIGVAYVLLCKANKVEEVIKRIQTWPDSDDKTWKAEVVGRSGKQAGWEKLVVLRIWR